MMAHNLTPHTLSSALSHRSSPYMSSQEYPASRHVPIISVPELLGAFSNSQAAAQANSNSNTCGALRTSAMSNEGWELPELKWLDAADNVAMPTENLSALDTSGLLSDSLKFSLDGERWPFSILYAGDRIAVAAVDDCQLSQFSLQSLSQFSLANSGSCGMVKNRSVHANPDNPGTIFKEAAGSSPTSSAVPEWRSVTSSGSKHLKRPHSDRPDSSLNSDRSTLERQHKVRVTSAEKCASDGPALSNSDLSSALTVATATVTLHSSAEKGRGGSCAAGVSTPPIGTASNQKLSAEKGSVITATNNVDQNVSPSSDSRKLAAAAVSDHEIHIWTERERRKKMNGMFSTLHALLPHLTSKADKSTIVDEAINYIQNLEIQMKALVKRRSDAAIPNSLSTSILHAAAQQNVSMGDMDSGSKLSGSGGISFCGEVKPTVGCSGKPSAAACNPASDHDAPARTFQTLCSPASVLNVCGSDVFATMCNPKGRPGFLCRVLFVIEAHGLHVLNAHISTTDGIIMYMFHAQTLDNQQFGSSEILNVALQELTNTDCLHVQMQVANK